MNETVSAEMPDLAEAASFFNRQRLSVRDFGKREVIINETDSYDTICMLLGGNAYLAGINENGKRGIIEYYSAGDIVGRFAFPSVTGNSYYFLASDKTCRVGYIEYPEMLKQMSVPFIEKLMKYVIFGKESKSSAHICILQQRTLEDKLMMFFEFSAERYKSSEFTLPMSYTDLADYLAADRSAMMREIKRLNECGKIISHKGVIKLKPGR